MPRITGKNFSEKSITEIKAEEHDIPMIIGGKEIRSGNKIKMHPPHEIAHTLGYFHRAERKHIEQAIQAALAAKPSWEATELGKPGRDISESSRSAGR